MDLSVVLPVINERDNLRELIPQLSALAARLRLTHEVIVVDGGSTDGTQVTATELGARVVKERRRGYAGALETGFDEARGDYLLTLDADMSHDPDFVAKLWRARERSDIVIASRYVHGGVVYTSLVRNLSSRLLNRVLRRMLSMPVRDLSSGFRLYRRAALQDLHLAGRNFEALEEILVTAYNRGFSVAEVPFTYFPRGSGRSHARLIRFGLDLARSAVQLWKLRNSLAAADYEERAFYSIIPLQRYWHRRRHRIVTRWARGAHRVLDIGCGSSIETQSFNYAIGIDLSLEKMRFMRRYAIPVVQGSAFALPFRDRSFDCVVCSEVIEHVRFDEALFDEMSRVLRPGGTLVIGTPDYARAQWRTIEALYRALAPSGYQDVHLMHYTRESLGGTLVRHGFVHEQDEYIAGAELIMRWSKPAAAAAGGA
ncbi:MAG TPA: glycosyltransferase [Candidatus Binataceae bacterium]|nr:glycosyltransferase [Candidatus Binataceae bacterium]